MKTLYTIILMIFTAACGFAQSTDGQQILDEAAGKLIFSEDISMQIEVSLEQRSTEKYFLFRRDSADTALLLQQIPAVMNGTGYLVLSGILWLYNPVCRCFEMSNEERSMAGMFLHFSDILPFMLIDDLTVEAIREGTLSGKQVFILECTSPDAGSQKLFISKDSGLPLYKEYIRKDGRISAAVTFHSYGEYKKKYVPLLFSVQTGTGVDAVVRCSDVSFKKLPDAVFTKSYLLEITR